MQTVKTIPGKTYAVESAGEVTITNTETGAIAAQGDGSGQVLFTACANSYTVSDDAAKVVALFKLAPRLKLALLQGGAGGWLPKGFTELDYLETSGTQYIKVSDIFGTNNDLVMGRFMIPGKDLTSTQILFGSRKEWRVDAFCLSFAVDTDSLAQFATQAMAFDCSPFLDKEIQLIMSRAGCRLNGTLVAEFAQATFTSPSPYFLFTTSNSGKIDNRMLIGRCYSFSIIRNGVTILDFVPVRNAAGEPGMWDKVSRRFFGNAGTGTFGYRVKSTGEVVAPRMFSLRDPYYTAPSGVYARKTGENALEIIADTENSSGAGWEWFANTAEAYEHFGIVPEEIEELLTE